MLYLLFEHTGRPQYWDARQLWAVQTLLSACIAAEPSQFQTAGSADVLKENLLADFGGFVQLEQSAKYFPDAAFREQIMTHVETYLAAELDTLRENIGKAEDLAPVPNTRALMECLSADENFKLYVESLSGGPKI